VKVGFSVIDQIFAKNRNFPKLIRCEERCGFLATIANLFCHPNFFHGDETESE